MEKVLEEFLLKVKQNGYFPENRKSQLRHWLHAWLKEDLVRAFYQNSAVASILPQIEKQVESGDISVSEGARKLLSLNARESKTE